MCPLTRSCFLLLLGRLFLPALHFLFGICLPSLGSPPFPPHTLALIPRSLPLMIWYSGLTALCLFFLVKVAPALLPTALSVATLSFSASPVCSSFSAEACAILHALCWSRQHQQVCHFSSLPLLSYSRSVLSSCSIRLQWVLRHSFLLGNDAADELARQRALPAPSAIPCKLSSLISRIHSFLGLEAYCLI